VVSRRKHCHLTRRSICTSHYKAPGDKSIAELAQIYEVHPTQITAWKKQLLEAASSVFEGKHAKAEATVDVDALYKKIGRLEMGRDFLASRPGVVAHLNRDGR
jgi:transposase